MKTNPQGFGVKEYLKFLICALIIFFVCALEIKLLNGEEDSEPQKHIAEMTVPAKPFISQSDSSLKATHLITTKCEASNTNITQLTDHSNFDRTVKNAKDKMIAAASKPAILLRNANDGDPASAIAAFALLRSCLPHYENFFPDTFVESLKSFNNTDQCNDLPPDLLKNPLAILRKAIENNSSEAKIVFAINSIDILKLMPFKSDQERNEVKNSILKEAENFAIEAAKYGEEDAYRFLAESYRSGIFGEVNFMKTYAYTLPQKLTQKNSLETAQRLSYLAMNLNNQQIQEANILAFGCDRNLNPTSNAGANPFGSIN